jgi:AraC-like DNA-binding protein/mannose-6-phosphate isomerase-like protein (cupin superfamily)
MLCFEEYCASTVRLIGPIQMLKSETQGSETRTCWRVPEVPGAVMFYGSHDYEFLSHSHDVVTVIVVTRGAVQIDVENDSFQATRGHLVMIGAHQVHSARPVDSRGWEMRTIHLPQEPLVAILRGHGNPSYETIHFSCPLYTKEDEGPSLFCEWHASLREAGSSAARADKYKSFMQWLGNNIAAFDPRRTVRRPCDMRLEHARKIIVERIFENVPIDRIAERAGLSAYSFIRRFEKHYGISPHAWRMQARANVAAQLLQERMPLVEVAVSCGFADQPHMARIFKKTFGVTPGQYRLMH